MLFELGRVLEIPSDAVKSAENDTEESKDDHAGVFVALRSWCVEGRDVCGTGSDGVGGDDTKDGCKDEGHEGHEGEEWEEANGGCEQEEEKNWEKEEPTFEEARTREIFRIIKELR